MRQPDRQGGAPPRSRTAERSTISSLTEGLRAGPSVRTILESLQVCLAIELATLPPYLTAYWSIEDPKAKAAVMLKRVYRDEMFHLGRICNLIAGLKAHPKVVECNPDYPGPLPGGVQPGLRVALAALSTSTAYTYMQVERPAFDPLAFLLTRVAKPTTIGEFYQVLMKALADLKPTFYAERQLPKNPIQPVANYSEAIASLQVLVEEGEGSEASPQQPDKDNAHYYEFAAIHHGAALKPQANGTWSFNGDPIPMPATYPIGEVPFGGYAYDQVSADVKGKLLAFDGIWTSLLKGLEQTWAGDVPDANAFDGAVTSMRQLRDAALALMKSAKPDGMGRYAPGFRVLP